MPMAILFRLRREQVAIVKQNSPRNWGRQKPSKLDLEVSYGSCCSHFSLWDLSACGSPLAVLESRIFYCFLSFL